MCCILCCSGFGVVNREFMKRVCLLPKAKGGSYQNQIESSDVSEHVVLD